jgi:hypothetical protein
LFLIREEFEGLNVSKFWKARSLTILSKGMKLCSLTKVAISMNIMDEKALIHFHPLRILYCFSIHHA